MKLIKLILTFAVLCCFVSCVSLHNGEIIQSSISSNKANFKIVKTISGEASATYILGIGGNMSNGLINEAKRNMYSSYEIKSNQNITNITTDIKKSYFIIPILYMSETAVVSADVIEFYDQEESQIYNNEINRQKNDSEIVTIKNRNLELFNDSLESRQLRNINEIIIGDKILVMTPSGFVLNGIVTKIGRDYVIEYKYMKNTGKYFYDEAGISNIRKIN